MADPFVGEIRMFAARFAPTGWHFCDGSLLPISENEELFTLIGTTYGGDGQSTFALPNTCSRFPVHQGQTSGGSNYLLGQTGGTETVTITRNQLPAHAHGYYCSTTAGGTSNVSGNLAAASQSITLYYEDAPSPTAALAPSTILPVGGDGPHDNMQPYLGMNFIISLFGTFPSPG